MCFSFLLHWTPPPPTPSCVMCVEVTHQTCWQWRRPLKRDWSSRFLSGWSGNKSRTFTDWQTHTWTLLLYENSGQQVSLLQRAQPRQRFCLLPWWHRPDFGSHRDRSSRSASEWEQERRYSLNSITPMWQTDCYFGTSRGYLIPFRLCSDPSDVALQRPQWKATLPTRNLELSPPPLTKNSPSTLMAT